MIRIAITQRVERVASYGESRDCLDQRWAALLEHLGIDPIPVPNGLTRPDAWLRRQAVSGLILSGGNDLCHLPGASNASPERDRTETSLLAVASASQLPVLAVCRGMQMLNHFLGGQLMPLSGHAGGLHPVSPLTEDRRFDRYNEANSFHSWGIARDGLATSLRPMVQAGDGSIEAFIHETLPWIGLMWHPERPSPCAEQDVFLIRHLFSSKDQSCT